MDKLFDKNDVITLLTREHVKIGDKGYFGDSLKDLDTNVKRGEVHVLAKIYDEDYTMYPFKGDHHAHCFSLFLPADKVKKAHTYRPIANLNELLVFLVPDLDISVVCHSAGNNNEISRYEKAKLLLGKQITISEKQSAFTTVLIIDRVDFYGDSDTGDAIHINGSTLNFLFENYEILIDGEWVPFGVRDYNEN